MASSYPVHTLWSLFVFLFMFSSALQAETLKGTARNSSGEVVYTELHEIDRSPAGLTTKVVTTYFKPDGKQFARLASDFSQSQFAPDSKFEDSRFDLVIEGKQIKSGAGSVYRITESKKGSVVKTSNIELKENLISGPGFDNFIAEKLLKAKNDRMSVRFLVLPRHEDYSFAVKKIDSPAETRVYSIKPATLLSLFVKEIVITYNAADNLLKKYEGLSNLPTDQDDSQNVVIEYLRTDSPVASSK